jgi:TM2 domain-containing membrane protein YozV
MRTTLLTFLIALFALQIKASENKYKIDDGEVETMFSQATDITDQVDELFLRNPNELPSKDQLKPLADDTQMIAGVVALASFFTGWGIFVPVHRFILGTGGRNGKIFALYCFTLSGCGFILLVDGLVLLINDHNDKYLENPNFIIW